MKPSINCFAVLICLSVLLPPAVNALPSSTEPVLECGTANPTWDKPQSKVWFAEGNWWAWLPSGNGGSRLWRRGVDGSWQSDAKLAEVLEKLPGRADVYAAGDLAVAALVDGRRMAVVALSWSEEDDSYSLLAPPLQWEEKGEVETVTIDRDAAGFFWIAYPADSADVRRIITRIIPPRFNRTGPPVAIADDVSRDDICVVVRMNGAIGVLWSNQNTEMILYSRHKSGTPVGDWWEADTVAAGGKTADDHLNFCKPRARSGEPEGVRLFAATKTSLDEVGKPLLAARVFNEDKVWTTVDFAELTETGEPSRPVALWLGDHPAIAYTVYGEQANHLELQHFAADGKSTEGKPEILLGPLPELNDVTGPKFEPAVIPVLLLASDNEGRVWEMFVEQGGKTGGKNRGPGGGAGGGGGKKKGGGN